MTEEKKPLSKAQFLQALADEAGTNKAEAVKFWEALTTVIRNEIGGKKNAQVSLPGLLKITKVEKPAKPAKIGVPNPFKPGETMDVAAKPATCVIKARPMKGLKDMI